MRALCSHNAFPSGVYHHVNVTKAVGYSRTLERGDCYETLFVAMREILAIPEMGHA